MGLICCTVINKASVISRGIRRCVRDDTLHYYAFIFCLGCSQCTRKAGVHGKSISYNYTNDICMQYTMLSCVKSWRNHKMGLRIEQEGFSLTDKVGTLRMCSVTCIWLYMHHPRLHFRGRNTNSLTKRKHDQVLRKNGHLLHRMQLPSRTPRSNPVYWENRTARSSIGKLNKLCLK